jgi:hypothetical protein
VTRAKQVRRTRAIGARRMLMERVNGVVVRCGGKGVRDKGVRDKGEVVKVFGGKGFGGKVVRDEW